MMFLATALACATDDPPRTRARELGKAPYLTVAASAGALLAGAVTDGDLGNPLRYELVDTETGDSKPVALPPVRGCQRTTYARPFPLARGTFGLLRTCRRVLPERTSETYAIVSYDPSSGAVRTVTPFPDPVDTLALTGAGELLAVESSAFCGELRRYRDGRLVPLGIALDADGWPLDEDRGRHETECRDHGLVNLSASTAQGVVAFVASPDAAGRAGTARLTAAFSVYVVTNGVARGVADVNGRPRALAWNADGTALYLSNDDDKGAGGVYEVRLDGTTRKLTDQVADDLAGVPRGVVMIEDRDGLVPTSLTLLEGSSS